MWAGSFTAVGDDEGISQKAFKGSTALQELHQTRLGWNQLGDNAVAVVGSAPCRDASLAWIVHSESEGKSAIITRDIYDGCSIILV